MSYNQSKLLGIMLRCLFPESSAKGHRYFLSEDQCRQSRAVFSIFSLLKARAPSDLSLSVRSGRARNLWTATKQVLKARIWTRISESGIVVHGDSEHRSPEADFGLPGAENQTFSIFHVLLIFQNSVFQFSILKKYDFQVFPNLIFQFFRFSFFPSFRVPLWADLV